MQSTLRRRMMLQLGLMVGGSLLMGLTAVIGVNGVHDDLNVAMQGNQELRQIYEVGVDAATAKHDLNIAHPLPSDALAAIESAMAKLDRSDYGGPQMPPDWRDGAKKFQLHLRLREAALQLDRSLGDPAIDTATLHESQRSAVNAVIGQLANLSTDVRSAIAIKQRAAENQRHATLVMTVSLSVIVVLAAIIIGYRQYRSVMRPLDRIGQTVRDFAAGGFGARITATGDREFISLANDFNFMAAELETLYRQLEEKVAIKSKELVRSERLASVGYLAAGVAHEMNNPLGIIAGYGERSLEHLAGGLDDTTLPRAQRAIQIMCEEAFRCKEITARLLSLARPGASDRGRVSIPSLVQEVISNLGGLREYSDRRITVDVPPGADLLVIGKDGEIRQVMVNLLLNAFQATLPTAVHAAGQIHVSVSAVGHEVEISVRDNGCGMTADNLDHIFEPFFTDKRGKHQPGTGLGLSITHAIVLDHGGRISAHSEGRGKGSRFTIHLPAAEQGADLANVA